MDTDYTELANLLFSATVERIEEQPEASIQIEQSLRQVLEKTWSDMVSGYPNLLETVSAEMLFSSETVVDEISKLFSINESPDKELILRSWKEEIGESDKIDLVELVEYLIHSLETHIVADPHLRSIFDLNRLVNADSLPQFRSIFSQVISITNLKLAATKAKAYASLEDVYYDAYGYEIFFSDLEINLARLRQQMIDEEYKPSPLRYVLIPKGSGQRKIYFTSPKDTIVLQAILNIIGPIFERKFSSSSFGNRLNVDKTESWRTYVKWQDQYNKYISRVRSFINFGLEGWYLISDIENYYPSISVNRLMGLISAHVKDERVVRIINSFVTLQAYDELEQLEQVKGLPPGCLHAHFFANLYLNDFDKLVEQKTLGYARYVDDICMLFSTEKELERVELELRQMLDGIGLHLKLSKTERHAITRWQTLFEHTSKMKYATRLDFAELLDLTDSQIDVARDAEQYFKELYRFLEEKNDIEQIAAYATRIILDLSENEVRDVDNIVYSLLEGAPLKPATLRLMLSLLLELELPNVTSRFNELFSNSNTNSQYFRMILMQMISQFASKAGNLKKLLLDSATDTNYLIRSSSFVAMKQLAKEQDLMITSKELRNLREKENSLFVRARLINCYASLEQSDTYPALVSEIGNNNKANDVDIAATLHELLQSGKISNDVLENFLPSFFT